MKEWLCLTCQMQRALTAAESVQPPLMKPQASPSKASAPAAEQKDVSETKTKDIIPTQKTDVLEKKQKESPKPEAPAEKMDIVHRTPDIVPPAKDTTATVSAEAKEEKVSSLPAKDVQAITAPPSEERQLPSQGAPVTTNAETSAMKKSDLTPSFPLPKEDSEKEKDKVETLQKTAEQLIISSDQIQEKQPLSKESHQVVAQKPQLENKQPQPVKAPLSEQTTVDKTPIESEKPEVAPKGAHSTCPLCKAELNMDSKNVPNYNTCTDCKTTVCNKCGFSPMPNVTEVIKCFISVECLFRHSSSIGLNLLV